MTTTRFGIVRRRVRRYRQDVEHWKADHDLALQCMDFELLLQHGLSAYEAINIADETWRRHVRRNHIAYDAVVEELITKLYRKWRRPCRRVLKQLREFEKLFAVEYAGEFRKACREVKGILTDDGQFFTGEALTRAQDEAIDSNRRGECEQWPPQ